MVVPLIPALKRHRQEELSEFESSRPAWFTQRVSQQLGLYSRPCFKIKSQSTKPKCLKDISGTQTVTLSPKDHLSLSQASLAVSFGHPAQTRKLDGIALVQ